MSILSSLLFIMYFLAGSSALDMSIVNNHQKHGPPKRTETEVRAMFESWLIKHGKNYNAIGEKEVRYQIFKDNLRFIDEHNSVERPYKVGLNIFSDLTLEEYRSTYLGEIPEDFLASDGNVTTFAYQAGEPLPDSVDWTTTGAIGPVRNQGGCSSCWAFVTANVISAINHIVTKKYVDLSPQQLVDCTRYSCRGGSRSGALSWVKSNGGLATEADYPYKERDGSCKTNAWTVSIDDYGLVTPRDEDALKAAVVRQPIAVGIDSRSETFKQYTSGIITQNCGTSLDHSVLLVGYGTENGIDYWLVKNSWGSDWGDKGYFKLQRNTGGVGMCGLATSPCYPIKTFSSNTDALSATA